MNILLRKTSLVDYPGRVSAVCFLPACNLRCPWCHNRELVTGKVTGLVSAEEALAHIRKRRNVLGGVALSGGEPCLYEALPDLIAEIKEIPLPVKLDTNGTLPAMLEKLFSRIETSPDYIALDLKIAPARYGGFGDKLIQSAALIRQSGVEHEYRTI
ncbi:MAG: anaerobic ribonucleoside-triphosphate reductase activating protein, partial [Treponema sp.]|nr:anaerobic ribonucleoside-triphosphate reductase activating protein [Treponema sp.]